MHGEMHLEQLRILKRRSHLRTLTHHFQEKAVFCEKDDLSSTSSAKGPIFFFPPGHGLLTRNQIHREKLQTRYVCWITEDGSGFPERSTIPPRFTTCSRFRRFRHHDVHLANVNEARIGKWRRRWQGVQMS